MRGGGVKRSKKSDTDTQIVENPNRKGKTPHLEDNLVIIKDPKRTRVCL